MVIVTIHKTLVMVIIFLVLLSSVLCAVEGIQPHPSVKHRLGKILQSTIWNHVQTYLRINKPVSVDVISKYRIPARSKHMKRRYKDCTDIKKNGSKLKYRDGVYTIQPNKKIKGVKVYCDMTTEGGGWTVIQRRIDGSLNFFRNWTDYKNGFGDVKSEYWLGNDILHIITKSSKQELRIDLEKFSGAKAYAKYKHFSVGDKNAKYRLGIRGYKGNAGNGLLPQNDMFFSTKDRDNDKWSRNCAIEYTGAWWYNNCHYGNLNGHYYKSEGQYGAKGVSWPSWGGRHNSMKSVKMMIRPRTRLYH